MWKFVLPLLLLAGLVLATVTADDAPPRADFTFINRGDVSTLDVQRASWAQDLRVIRCLHEGLVRNNIFTHEFRLEPGVAERWEISEDGRTYTFHLRAGAKWSNGEPVRASDFVFSWRRTLLPDTASDYTALFQLIEGAREFYAWREEALKAFTPGPGAARALWAQTEAKFAEMVRMQAVDERTFRFTLVRPTPYFLDLCAFAVSYPVYPPLVSRYETPSESTGRLEIRSGWTKPGVHIGNGAFRLATWRFKRDMRLVRNEHYWDAGRIALDSIEMPSVTDPNASVLAYRSGAVDWVSDVTPEYRAAMLEAKWAFYREHQAEVDAMRAEGLDPFEIARRLPPDPRNHTHPVPAFGTYFWNFNCMPKLRDGRDNPFYDKRVRRAFAMAIDKRRIVDEVRRSGEPIASTLVPPGSLRGYVSPKGLAYDPAAARALLAEAGFPGGKGFITVEMLFNKDAGHDKIAEAIKKDWEENLGVNVSLETREIKVFRNDLKNQNFMVSRAGWFGDYGDPTTFLDLLRKDDGNNDRKYADEAYERLMDEAAATADPEARLRILSEAERKIVEEDLPLIPLYQYVQVYLFDPHKITGISSHPRQEQNPFEVDVLGDGKGAERPKVLPPLPGRGERVMPDRMR